MFRFRFSRHVLVLFLGRFTCTAACSMARALFGSLCLDSAATEGGAVSDLLAFLLRWRSAHRVWTIAGRVHPPAGTKRKKDKEEALG